MPEPILLWDDSDGRFRKGIGEKSIFGQAALLLEHLLRARDHFGRAAGIHFKAR